MLIGNRLRTPLFPFPQRIFYGRAVEILISRGIIYFSTPLRSYTLYKELHVAPVEKTLAIIKPDAFAGKVAGKIVSIIEENGFHIAAMKTVYLSRRSAQQFYAVHTGKSFYDGLVQFMASGPCIVLVLEGENIIERWRSLMGPTDPENAPEGSIRKLYGTTVRHNATHGSDSPQAAAAEIAFFFAGVETLPSGSPRQEGEN